MGFSSLHNFSDVLLCMIYEFLWDILWFLPCYVCVDDLLIVQKVLGLDSELSFWTGLFPMTNPLLFVLLFLPLPHPPFYNFFLGVYLLPKWAFIYD